MAEYLRGAFDRGTLSAERVLLFDDSLEASNATAQELIGLATQIAANPAEGRPPVELRLTADQLLANHQKRRERARKNKPGLADTLISMATDDEHGPVLISKRELAAGLGQLIVDEYAGASEDERPVVLVRRPVLRFVLEQLVPAINRARPAGRRV
jgi:hypothetical protein